MFEALELLKRIRDHFGQECVVSFGIYQDMASISVSWDNASVICHHDLPMDIIQSAVANDAVEKMVIVNIENSHKMWEVGEI